MTDKLSITKLCKTVILAVNSHSDASFQLLDTEVVNLAESEDLIANVTKKLRSLGDGGRIEVSQTQNLLSFRCGSFQYDDKNADIEPEVNILPFPYGTHLTVYLNTEEYEDGEDFEDYVDLNDYDDDEDSDDNSVAFRPGDILSDVVKEGMKSLDPELVDKIVKEVTAFVVGVISEKLEDRHFVDKE